MEETFVGLKNSNAFTEALNTRHCKSARLARSQLASLALPCCPSQPGGSSLGTAHPGCPRASFLLLGARESQQRSTGQLGAWKQGTSSASAGKCVLWCGGEMLSCPLCPGQMDLRQMEPCLTTISYCGPSTCSCPPAPGWLDGGSARASSLPAE